MEQLLLGALLPVSASAIFALWATILKREKTYKWGLNFGKAFSRLLGQKIFGGDSYEKNEHKIQSTLYDLTSGIIDGMDADDSVKWKH